MLSSPHRAVRGFLALSLAAAALTAAGASPPSRAPAQGPPLS